MKIDLKDGSIEDWREVLGNSTHARLNGQPPVSRGGMSP